MTMQSALKEVLHNALVCDGLARGINEAARALDRKEGRLCILAESCDHDGYTRLVEALCQKHNIDRVKVPDAKELGEWCGLCKYDEEGKPRKVVACACAVITKFGAHTEATHST
eukprot:GABW01001659.1.p2 GENE.GABW01001659.1~~GABW01001659.1.p2  ORF type:complete len:114 (-),score=38.97 GABW01001659.1:3-344(-)